MSDRETTPKYWEVKKVYAPVQLAVNNGQLIVTNRNHHIDLSQYRCLWTLTIDGKQKEQGEITLPKSLRVRVKQLLYQLSVPYRTRRL